MLEDQPGRQAQLKIMKEYVSGLAIQQFAARGRGLVHLVYLVSRVSLVSLNKGNMINQTN